MERESLFGKTKRLVVKVGSSTLTHENGRLNLRRIGELVRVLADLRNSGLDGLLVTSGAVACGMARPGFDRRPSEMPKKQACAAVGQCELLHIYDKYFSEYSLVIGQVLLTHGVFDSEQTRKNAENTFETMLSYGVIPIVNENDAISTYELESLNGFGDNDHLSVLVSILCRADLLVIMSDIDGLFDCDPHENPGARLIPVVEAFDGKLKELAGARTGKFGTGGMASKLAAAELATQNGIDMVIANGAFPENLWAICEGKGAGTRFISKKA